MKKLLSITKFFLPLLSLASLSCSAEGEDTQSQPVIEVPGEPEIFPDLLLESYTGWTPILAGDQTFASQRHGGVQVKVYLNDVAKSHIDSNRSPFPLIEGSILAKAVVNVASGVHTRVYFMKKEKPGS